MTTISQTHAPHHGFPRPSGKTILAAIAVLAVVWAAISVQAAILGDRQDNTTAQLRQEIQAAKSASAQVAPAQTLPMEVSDQAKAAAFDASLPAASLAPVKDISITSTDTTMIGIAKDVNFQGWSFGDSVPAKPLHVRQGDTVNFTLTNNGTMGHGIDFHAAQIDPGANYKTVMPGETFSFSWKAEVPGVFMFHCSAAPVIEHIANGMYGAIVVDPATPLPPAREYVLVQSEFYPVKKGDTYVGDVNAMLADKPGYVVFNGMFNQYREHPLLANPGELVRLYVVDAGPNHNSDFHVIGAIFSGVYPDGNLANKLTGVQTYTIPAGGAAMFELTMNQPGTYPFVTHSFADASHGAIGAIQVGNPPATGAAVHDMSAPSSADAAAAAAAKLDLSSSDNKFSQTAISAQVGKPVTITLANKGAAMHNLHVVGLPGADGKDVQTPLLEGGKSASVTFTPSKAGTYKFQCDVHPAEMTGTLTIK
jgi:nitrite reductase (NO-forming)